MRTNKTPAPSITPIVKADPAAINARRNDGQHIDQKALKRRHEAERAGEEWRKTHARNPGGWGYVVS